MTNKRKEKYLKIKVLAVMEIYSVKTYIIICTYKDL